MAIQSDETLVTKGNLKELYQDKILPYLGGNFALSTNVSDYYSTDEKIIGVWVDGKPLYSKTLTGSTSVAGNAWSDTGIVTPNNITLIELLPIRYLDGSQFQTIPCIGYIENNHLRIFNTRNNTYAVSPIYATIYYTKTTDAASSAATTPGCYDINFPNMWPTEQEIYFGNGVYGVHLTGTLTQRIPNRYNFGTNFNNIINYGGGIKGQANAYFGLADYYVDTPASYGFGFQIQIRRGNETRPVGALDLFAGSTTYGANANYDIWFTYTKA